MLIQNPLQYVTLKPESIIAYDGSIHSTKPLCMTCVTQRMIQTWSVCFISVGLACDVMLSSSSAIVVSTHPCDQLGARYG
eukprot:m.365599 g.365599  ORF g.365599 m.365599 type:complete len:80 (+) comp32162_c0_seq1:43-282(+)